MQHIAASMSLRRDSCVLHVHVGDQIPDSQSEERLHACTLPPCKNDTTPQKVWNSLGTENWNVSGSDAWWSAPFKAGALRTVSEDSLPHVHPHNSTSRWVEVFWKSALVVSATSQSLRTCANKSARLDVSDMHMNWTYHPTVWNYVIYFETVAHKKSPQPQKSSRVIVASGVPANFSFHLELLRYAPECPKGPAESPAPSYETASIRNMCIVQTIKTMALPGHWTDKSKRIGVKAHTGGSSEQRQATCNALPDSFDWSTQVRSSRPCSPALEACAWLNYSSPLVATRPGRSQPHMARWLLSPSPPLCPFRIFSSRIIAFSSLTPTYAALFGQVVIDPSPVAFLLHAWSWAAFWKSSWSSCRSVACSRHRWLRPFLSGIYLGAINSDSLLSYIISAMAPSNQAPSPWCLAPWLVVMATWPISRTSSIVIASAIWSTPMPICGRKGHSELQPFIFRESGWRRGQSLLVKLSMIVQAWKSNSFHSNMVFKPHTCAVRARSLLTFFDEACQPPQDGLKFGHPHHQTLFPFRPHYGICTPQNGGNSAEKTNCTVTTPDSVSGLQLSRRKKKLRMRMPFKLS